MKTIAIAVLAALALVSRGAVYDLDGEWDFRFDGEESFREVTVPHDWAIGGNFDSAFPDGSGMLGWQRKGEYRKRFVLSRADAATLADGGEAYLEFDGVMARPQVEVNGTKAGGSLYGYLGFSLKLARILREGENEISVRADTTQQDSRFYCGGGIFRDVRLRILPKGHVVPGSVFIRAEEVSRESAKMAVDWELDDGRRGCDRFEVENPRLWDVDDPYLYEYALDGEKYRYGIRSCLFTADDGFHLNGRRLQIKGVCLHADLGLVGMAFSKDVARRQLAIMREMGVNAIRTSHNCPDPKFLDLCDEMGFVVWDECFDKWDWSAGWMGEGNVDQYVRDTLSDFVRRDRNHPSVVVWSIGNEIGPKSADYFPGVERSRVRAFKEAVNAADPTRQVGIAAWQKETVPDLQDLDVTGWNYARRYMPMKLAYPGKAIVYSESGSSVSDFGYYADARPAAARTAYDRDLHRICGYDYCSAWYSDIADPEFWRMEKDRFVAGEFVWTGIDYIGEPSPWYRGGPDVGNEGAIARSSSFGIVDLTGFPKDRFWLYRSHWNGDAETVHILPHWNWEGRASEVTVMVYTSGDEAELFLNGRSLGRRAKSRDTDYPLDWDRDLAGEEYYRICDRYRLKWEDVPFEPGEIKAVAYRDGVAIGEDSRTTAGPAAGFAVEMDPFSRPGDDIVFYRVSAVDSAGVVDPWNDTKVELSVEGPGELAGFGNADPHDRTGFASPVQKLFFGRAMAAVRRTGPGEIRVSAREAAAPLIGGFNPDPSICRAGDFFYIVTSSFELSPGIPVYRSRDLRHWELISHVWSHPDFQTYEGTNCDNGIWAPSIRFAGGRFYVTVTFTHATRCENYLVWADDPEGPWSRPVKLEENDGIDPSLFFDDDGKVYYTANTWSRFGKSGIKCQEIDVEAGKLLGEPFFLTEGAEKNRLYTEAPHIYKKDGRYWLLVAQGGTEYTHEGDMLVADDIHGPYVEVPGNPVITALDWGPDSPLQAFGHADLVETPDGRWYSCFLGKRAVEPEGISLFGRETFMCPVEWTAQGGLEYRRDELMNGSVVDRTDTRYGLMTHPDWNAKLRRVSDFNQCFETILEPGESIIVYRSTNGYYARTNDTDSPAPAAVLVDRKGVRFTLGGKTGEWLPIKPLCDSDSQKFNGLMAGTCRFPSAE
ncbi:MAG: family 43 glycosylhydrolase [Kiritimatiellae bacterium]|nr:family 43 glycosylhydrolase [Kiritimatiellia bacterium]